MKALVIHPGTQHSFRLATELQVRGALAGFYTGLALIRGGMADTATAVVPARWRRRLANRRISGVPASKLYLKPWLELAALWRLRRGHPEQEVLHRRNGKFQRLVPAQVMTAASAVIGFDTSSWILSERSRQVGTKFILDQSIGHPDAKLSVYAQIGEKYPDWNDSIESRIPEVRLAEQQEHDGAHRIVAASTFTKNSLTAHGVAESKIRINPYGVDCELFMVNAPRPARPLRFLFVGLMDARKGLPLLLAAWQRLRTINAELWLVGHASARVRERILPVPGLKIYGAVPREEVARLMRQCDVFVFPSYFEGFGLVLLEAMACGLPVITTTATAGPDIVSESEDGWVITPGDVDRLADRMTWCLEHPDRVSEMGRQARVTAERFSWSAYGDRWMDILAEACV